MDAIRESLKPQVSLCCDLAKKYIYIYTIVMEAFVLS